MLLTELLARQARDNARSPFCRFGDDVVTFGDLDGRVNRLANGLARAGIGSGDRVAVMLPSHPDHVYTMLALARLGVTHVPVNVQHRASGIHTLLQHAGITAVIADSRYRGDLGPALTEARAVDRVVWRQSDPGHSGPRPRATSPEFRIFDFDSLLSTGSPAAPPAPVDADPTAMILYTSGTTGPQKGVMVTDRMYQVAAKNAGIAADVRPGDVLFLWEPLHHVAGVQTVILCLQQGVACAMVERFSASRFWDQVRRYRATQVHYLGNVLGLLMKQPERPDDADNPARIAYGAPAAPDLWPRFEKRFGVKIHECYGMTEASSFTTINTWGRVGSIGKPVPEFEVRIVDEEDRPVPAGSKGEIVQREREPGVLTKGYLNDPGGTAKAFRNGWFHTGDLGYYDTDGFYYFAGRKKDVIRSRGENVSAWVVERAASAFPGVEECAAIGVPSGLGEEDIKLIVRRTAGQDVDPAALTRWLEGRLARFEVPRYVEFIAEFPKTPSERIRKADLSRSTDCWDAQGG